MGKKKMTGKKCWEQGVSLARPHPTPPLPGVQPTSTVFQPPGSSANKKFSQLGKARVDRKDFGTKFFE